MIFIDKKAGTQKPDFFSSPTSAEKKKKRKIGHHFRHQSTHQTEEALSYNIYISFNRSSK